MTIANNMGNGGTSATLPSTLRSNVTIDAYSGEVTLISSGAKDEKITTFRLNLTSLKAIDFQFCENAGSIFDIYDAKLSDDLKSLNIYIFSQKSLFDDNDSLVIGTVSNPTYVKAENMDYVLGDDVVELDTKLRTYVPETVSKSDDSDEVESDTKEVVVQADVYGLEAGEQFRNLNYSLLTKTAASKVITTTTSTVTTTTTKRTRSTTTTEGTTTTTTTETTTTPTTTVTHIASDEKLCNWSVNDYNDKHKNDDHNSVSAEIVEKSNNNYEIILKDDSDNVLDVYDIDSETGVGEDSHS